MRKNRAVAYDGRPETGTTLPFFTEYIDPGKKRRYRELESEPYAVRFPDRDRSPKAFALDRPGHLRRASRLMGFIQENPRAGQLTAPQKVVARVLGDREAAEAFLRTVVPLLIEYELLADVTGRFPVSAGERTSRLRILQIDPRHIRLRFAQQGYRCNACQTWRPYSLSTCPTPNCRNGRLIPSSLDRDNYYVRLYLERPPRRFAVAEHSAQIAGEERARREKAFKNGKLDALVCTPTLELGVDIGPLLTVVLRNAPPTPANYAQRVGRAGRRLRTGFVSTFCAGKAHDRHAFERPEWFVAGRFDPPRLRLGNPKIVLRHLRSYLLAQLENELPYLLKDLLDDVQRPTRWKPEELGTVFREIRERRDQLVQAVLRVTEYDRRAGLLARYGEEDVTALVDGFEQDLTSVLERWWRRVEQLDREFRHFSALGSDRDAMKKAEARQRAYREITQDPERAYTLNYLAAQQVLPAYQFPLETFTLDPGVSDTPTIYRAATIAIEEFAPGNFVYANGHKLRSIRVLFPGGPGKVGPARSDAEAAGRLEAFHFCSSCDEVVESGRNTCPRCGAALGEAADVVFVEAFEAEESLRITSEEESRQRASFDCREYLRPEKAAHCRLYPYPLHPVEFLNLAEILLVNWGPVAAKGTQGRRFWLCPDCGRHMPYDPEKPGTTSEEHESKKWNKEHKRLCKGEPVPLLLAHRFQADTLVLTIPVRQEFGIASHSGSSPTARTLAEALRAGCGRLLELEPDELGVFLRRCPEGSSFEEIVFYETVPGGAGYLEEMAERLSDVARAAQEVLFGHDCGKACYLCLKHYRNQGWHASFDKNLVRDVLVTLANLDPVAAQDATTGEGRKALAAMLEARAKGGLGSYPKGEIEELLRSALERLGVTHYQRDYEVKDEGGRLVTVPDFAWPDLKVAVYCDGYAYHGKEDVLALDAKKRNFLQIDGWMVLTFWGQTVMKNAEACAQEVKRALAARQVQGIKGSS
jgi:very-short-patch-repair endonuclease